MEIREATAKDLKKIVDLLEGASEEFGHASVPFCKDTTRNMLQRVITHQNHIAFILVDGDKIRGILAGLNNQLWYSKKRQVSALVFYVDSETRGYGARLLSTFLGWARKVPNVVEIAIDITSGAKDIDRISGLLEAVGMVKVGSMHTMHPTEGGKAWAA